MIDVSSAEAEALLGAEACGCVLPPSAAVETRARERFESTGSVRPSRESEAPGDRGWCVFPAWRRSFVVRVCRCVDGDECRMLSLCLFGCCPRKQYVILGKQYRHSAAVWYKQTMTVLSRRGQEAPVSPIRKLEPLAQVARQKNIKIYHLNIGQPDIPTPAPFLNHARLTPGQVLAYSPSAGLYALRTEWARHYSQLGLPIQEEDLLVTTGGSEALMFALLALCNPGEEIITPEPFYPNYRMFTMMAGARIRPLPTTIENNFQLPSPETFANAITDKTKAILLCNPSNPTGAVYSRESLEEVVALCLKKGIALIADEVYREFVYEGEPRSILSIAKADEVAIVIDSFSKRFSACGARVGCLVSKIAPIIDAATRFAMSRLSPPTLGQLGGTAMLAQADSFVPGMITEFRHRRDVLMEELNRLPGVFAPKAQGAFYLMVRLPVDSAENFCRWLLTDFSYQGETIMLAPGPGFYETPGTGTQEVRMAYVLGAEPLRHAVQLLGRALLAYPGRIQGHSEKT